MIRFVVQILSFGKHKTRELSVDSVLRNNIKAIFAINDVAALRRGVSNLMSFLLFFLATVLLADDRTFFRFASVAEQRHSVVALFLHHFNNARTVSDCDQNIAARR